MQLTSTQQIHQIACIAIINNENVPVIYKKYMNQTPDESLFKLQVLNSLDIIEQIQSNKLGEETINKQIPFNDYNPPYLGCINSIQLIENEYDVYAYITTIKVKVIVIIKQKKNLDKYYIVSNLCRDLFNIYQVQQFSLFGYSNIHNRIDCIIKDFEKQSVQ